MTLDLPKRPFVCISSIDWDFLWQGHQEICSRFASAGFPVLYVENTGVRTVRLRDATRLLRRLRRAFHRAGARSGVSNVQVVSPLLLPFPRSRLASAINTHILLPRLARHLAAHGARDAIVFTFLPTPNAIRLAEHLRTPRSVLVYYCIAEFSELSDLGSVIEEAERQLVRSADLVFVQSELFARRFAGLNDAIHEVQFGVNLDLFDRARTEPSPELSGLPRPIIGYSGGLHRHVDLGLIAQVAKAFPKGSVVLIGAVQRDLAAIQDIPNIHLLGQRSIRELPALIAALDVGLVPYERTAFTDSVFPTKLCEYLAMGVPAVSTDLPEVLKHAFPLEAVRVATDAEEFVVLVGQAVASRGSDEGLRIGIARERDWRTIVARMAELIAGVNAGPR